MRNALKIFLYFLFFAIIVIAFYYWYQPADDDACPREGDAKSYSVMNLNRLKNRTAIPATGDIDKSITLENMLAPGDDRNRWSTEKAAELTGYVEDVKVGGVETCNCHAKESDGRDTHIELVLHPMNYTRTEKIIVEITPRIRKMMAKRGLDWSTNVLRDKILGRWIKVQGWMLYDFEHQRQAENMNPGGDRNWRATVWEIHPVTSLEVVDGPRTKNPN